MEALIRTEDGPGVDTAPDPAAEQAEKPVAGVDAAALAAEPRAEPTRIRRSRRRDTHLRRLLALADLLSLVLAIAVGIGLVGTISLKPGIIAVPLLGLLGMKLLGLYDRDAPMIHKTTLEEIPNLFAASAVAVLVVYLGGSAFVEGTLGSLQGLLMVSVLFLALVILRAGARRIWRASVPRSAACLSATRTASPSSEARSRRARRRMSISSLSSRSRAGRVRAEARTSRPGCSTSSRSTASSLRRVRAAATS